MKGEDIAGLILLIILLLISEGMLFYDSGHLHGYLKATHDTELYYQTTGEFPSGKWTKDARSEHFNYKEDIMKSLYPYKEIK